MKSFFLFKSLKCNFFSYYETVSPYLTKKNYLSDQIAYLFIIVCNRIVENMISCA
jgi:hypothetical protein